MGKFELLTSGMKLPTGRRTAIIGPPNSFKTTSLLTWPRPIAILSFPAEKGYDTIPLNDPTILPFIWRLAPEEDITKLNPHELCREIETTTAQIIAGKYGKVRTFAGDGLHKLYDCFYMRARKDLDAFDKLDEGTKDARAYGVAHKDFAGPKGYLSMVTSSSVEYAVFTGWMAKERDDPDDTRKNAPTHLWARLPGQMAQDIIGEFSVVMAASVVETKPGSKKYKGLWQLKPEGRVWGVGVKGEAKVVESLPVFVDADWKVLEPLLLGGVK